MWDTVFQLILDRAYVDRCVVEIEANDQPCPFTDPDFARLVWGLPAAMFTLASTALPDHGFAGSETKFKDAYYDACYKTLRDIVRLGDWIPTPVERDYLHRLGVFGSGIFRSIESRNIASGELLFAVTQHRKRSFEHAILVAKYPFGPELSISPPSLRIDENTDEIFTGIGLLASVAATGKSDSDDSRRADFVAAILSMAMNAINDAFAKGKTSL